MESIGSDYDRNLRARIDPLCAQLTPTGKMELALRLTADAMRGVGVRGLISGELRGTTRAVEGDGIRRAALPTPATVTDNETETIEHGEN